MKKLIASLIMVMFVAAFCWVGFSDEQQINNTEIKMGQHTDSSSVIVTEFNDAEGSIYLAQARCSGCSGKGFVTCQACNGSGQVKTGTTTGSGGTRPTYGTCYSCKGAGSRTCGSCYGKGVR